MNRAITEGRARFLKVYAEIEAGEECERFAPTLAALVGGTASADALLELRPHIRNCATCRATVRQLHATRLGRLRALWPVPALLAPLRWALQRTGDGVASVKQHAAMGYSRALDPTPLAGVRPGAAVAAVAGCLAVGGGTTYCVSQGVDPVGGLARVVSPSLEKRQAEAPRRKREPKRRASVEPVVTPAPTPFATPTPVPSQPPAQETVQATPQPTPVPTPQPIPADEYEPVAPASAASTAPPPPAPAARKPAPAPAGAPGEFDGP